MQTRWTERYAQRTHGLTGSVVRELLKLAGTREVISFAGGLPAADQFPLERFREAAETVLREHGPHALQYSATEGERPLRELIARHTRRYGIAIEPDNVLITAGSQQALDLVGKVFINPGDHVVVERPTYLGALQAWNAYQAEYLPIGIDDDGMRIEELGTILRGGAKFIYALPNFQNPSGVTLSLARRQALVRLADQQGVPIFEDDPYGQLRYEGSHLPPIVAIDAAYRGSRKGATYTGNVLYSSTFSKTLAPGLRLGWIIGPVDVIQRLAQVKQGVDLHTGTFVQLLAYEVARAGFLDRHIRALRPVYAGRRDRMLAAMAASFPRDVRWTRPQGGLFIWVTLPDTFDATDALSDAVADKVAYVPGSAFFTDGAGRNTLRLNFTNVSFEQIDEGIARLGRFFRRHAAASGGHFRPLARPLNRSAGALV